MGKNATKGKQHLMIKLYCAKANKPTWHNSITKKDGMFRCTCCAQERGK